MSEQTNSYEKYHKIKVFIDNNSKPKGVKDNQPISAYKIALHIGLSNKQTIRCINEIVSIDNDYELTKIGKVTAVIKKKEHEKTKQ